MGTTYTVHKDKHYEIELDEMSNKLQLVITASGDSFSSDKMEPETIIQMALKMLKVCSYWTEPGTVEKIITEFKSKGYHW